LKVVAELVADFDVLVLLMQNLLQATQVIVVPMSALKHILWTWRS